MAKTVLFPLKTKVKHHNRAEMQVQIKKTPSFVPLPIWCEAGIAIKKKQEIKIVS